jgi:hypothetical protein
MRAATAFLALLAVGSAAAVAPRFCVQLQYRSTADACDFKFVFCQLAHPESAILSLQKWHKNPFFKYRYRRRARGGEVSGSRVQPLPTT